MTEVTNNYNLDSHYSTNPKAQRVSKPVASPPNSMPIIHVFNDADANARMKMINQDIYQDSKTEKNRGIKNFAIVFGGIICLVTGIKFAKRIFK